MRRRLFAPLASAIVISGIAVLTSCGSSLGGPNGAGGSGGGGASGTGGETGGGTGGMTTGGSGGTAGGSGGHGGAGGRGGAPGTGGAQAGGKGGGAAPCGTQTCASNEICIQPGCGGGVAVCDPVADGGQCPAGWTLTLCAGGTGRLGCTPGPCTPPAPFCAPLPASCAGAPNCICLPFDVCGQNGGQCSGIRDRTVMCGFA